MPESKRILKIPEKITVNSIQTFKSNTKQTVLGFFSFNINEILVVCLFF